MSSVLVAAVSGVWLVGSIPSLFNSFCIRPLIATIAYEQLGKNSMAITGVSPALASQLLNEARSQAKWIGIKHLEILPMIEGCRPECTGRLHILTLNNACVAEG